MKLFLFVSLGLITTLVFTSASLHIDVPGPPGRPVITDINRHGCTITWTPPRYDGGAPVTHYQVEYREEIILEVEKGDPTWVSLGTFTLPAGKSRVVLDDRGVPPNEDEHASKQSQIVVADAVKWVKK